MAAILQVRLGCDMRISHQVLP